MRLFVTGTDTNVGKTIISSWLMHKLDADYWKPIQSGTDEGFDAEIVQNLSNADKTRIHPESYRLKAPLSPYAAAELENISISLDQIKIPEFKKTLIIEGAGGVLVPLNETSMVVDLIKKLEAHAIVVASTALGTINHTCLTLEALHHRQIPILGIILNGPLNPLTRRQIETHGRTPILAEIEPMDMLTAEKLASIPLPRPMHHLIKATPHANP